MRRFLAGGLASLLLASVGVLWWTGSAQREEILIPAAPKAERVASVQTAEPEALPAASAKTREERRFARYDKDEDGIITRAEMMETRRKAFEKLDANGDGRLAFDEWAIATAERFGTADKDRSGTLTSAEFATTKRETKTPPRCNC